MRRKISIVLMACLMVSFLALPALTQAQEQEPQLYATWEVVVHPAHFMEYEAAMKKLVALCAKHECPFPWTASRTEDFHYFFLIPIENLAAMDKVFSYFEKMAAKAGEEYTAVEKAMAGTFKSETIGAVYLRYDLSYIPEQPRLTVEDPDANFIAWYYFYIRSGMQKKVEEILHEFQALYKSKGITDAWSVYQGILWKDIPAFVVVALGKAADDYYAQGAKNSVKLGDQYMPLMKKILDLSRRVETKTGAILRELSYIPKEK